MMKYLQKLGKALMLPVAVLPICGILMGLGYALAPGVMGVPGAPTSGAAYTVGFLLVKAGGALIDNMAWLFAIGAAVGLADNDGTAGLAGLVSYLMMQQLLSPGVVGMVRTLEEGTATYIAFQKVAGNSFIGILAAVVGAACYNKFKNIQLPDWLAFFSGKRFVAIATGLISILVSVVLLFVWPVIFGALVALGMWNVEVPQDGWYQLSFHYSQSYQEGQEVYRTLEIDGQVPADVFREISFAYTGTPYAYRIADNAVWLTKGHHTLALLAESSQTAVLVTEVQALMDELSDIGLSLQQVAGSNADNTRSWEIETYIPDVIERMRTIQSKLNEIYDRLEEQYNEHPAEHPRRHGHLRRGPCLARWAFGRGHRQVSVPAGTGGDRGTAGASGRCRRERCPSELSGSSGGAGALHRADRSTGSHGVHLCRHHCPEHRRCPKAGVRPDLCRRLPYHVP